MPINFTPQQRQALLAALGNGRQNAIGAKRLAQQLGFPTGGNQVQLRALIKECIEHDGDLIVQQPVDQPVFYYNFFG